MCGVSVCVECVCEPVGDPQVLAVTPDDGWAVHAVAHVYEMRAELDKGLKFMESREKDWQVGPGLQQAQILIPPPPAGTDPFVLSCRDATCWRVTTTGTGP